MVWLVPIFQTVYKFMVEIFCIKNLVIQSGDYFIFTEATELVWHEQNCDLTASLKSKSLETELIQDFKFSIMSLYYL